MVSLASSKDLAGGVPPSRPSRPFTDYSFGPHRIFAVASMKALDRRVGGSQPASAGWAKLSFALWKIAPAVPRFGDGLWGMDC